MVEDDNEKILARLTAELMWDRVLKPSLGLSLELGKTTTHFCEERKYATDMIHCALAGYSAAMYEKSTGMMGELERVVAERIYESAKSFMAEKLTELAP